MAIFISSAENCSRSKRDEKIIFIFVADYVRIRSSAGDRLRFERDEKAIFISSAGDRSRYSLENSTATWRDLIASPFLWVISLLILLILGTTTAVIDWGQLYLIQDREQSNYVGSTFMSLYGIGGTIGSIIPSYIADRLVAKQSPGSTFNPRLTVVLALSALTVNFLHLFTYCVTSESSQLWISVLAFGLGFGLYGSVALLGVVAVECAPPHLSGTSHALYGIGSNVGSVLAGLPLSYVAKYYNWSGVFVVLEAVGILTVAILVACRWMSHVIAVDKKKKTD